MSNTTPREIDAPVGAEALMQEYALAEAQLQQAKDAMKPLRAKLLAMLTERHGSVREYVVSLGVSNALLVHLESALLVDQD